MKESAISYPVHPFVSRLEPSGFQEILALEACVNE
jgi:hypothetical protein